MYTLIQEKNYTKVRFQEKERGVKNILKAHEMLKLMRYYGIDSIHDKKTKSSYYRTKKNIQDIIEHNLIVGSRFITLTYAENMQDYYQAQKDYNKFIKKMKYYYGDIKYICIKELQKRGAIHYHLIWFNAKEITKKRLADIWSNGFIHQKEILDLSNLDRITNYLMKYLTEKEKNKDIKKGFRKFTKSNNLIMSYKTKLTYQEYLKHFEKVPKYVITKTKKDIGYTELHIMNKKKVDILPF